MKKRIIAGILGLTLALTSITGCSGSGNSNTSSGGQAQADAGAAADYPEKNITIILPYGAGSSQEALLRVACKYVEKNYNFKKSFVISNQEGGSGEMGLTAAFNAPHDGYTLAMFHSPHIALKLVRGDSCKFSYEDFMPITNFMTDPCSWLINSENAGKYPDFGALVEAAKAAPGTVSVACGGVNTSEGRLIKQIQRATGAEFKIVPIDNDAEFVSMLRGNHVDALVTQVGDVMAPIEEGVFIPLCVGTSERIETLADVPTLKELGYDIESYSMRSLAALKGTPDDIYELLCKAFDEAMHSEEVTKKAEELGVTIDYKTPEEVYAMWGEIDKANRKEWEVDPWN
ncbi:tripartite tricarboxylate transporter substrate binding protein [Enterocloster citroniae]|uniref:Tripartite-type tricarboxylate transporter receptor subunit TctC n=2 Tax=Enterocloster citroniae TaxID=358743 RepID=A0ABV2FV48_9FIRM|nr:tripartite tricarboxylate transporter substrate binding protein [Enterocloster citroniae]KMW17227.1 hypothetical protein HMPREF9470_03880 [[Clostridium] citroniae WAL-19142]